LDLLFEICAMSLYIQSYLTDAEKVKKVFGCKNKLFFEKILLKLRDDLDDIDADHEEFINFDKNAKSVLLDIINGKIQFEELAFIYVLVYEKLCGVFGEQIYSPNDEYSVPYFQALGINPSAFIPIPMVKNTPFIYSIPVAKLFKEKQWFLGLTKPDTMSQKDFDMEQSDFAFAFDKAMKENKDLVFSMY
jgi:hypothetical protein